METHQFRASVQYGDWKGTSAADVADMIGPRDWLKKQGHMKDGEFLLGVRFFAGGNHAAHKDPVHAEFLLVQPTAVEFYDASPDRSHRARR